MIKPLYQILAGALDARANCIKSGNAEWRERHAERAIELTRKHMPSGSGIDNGTLLVLGESNGERLTFTCGFHHMSPDGFYLGWTAHKVTVRASLRDAIDIRISGPDRNGIKDYLYDVFDSALRQEVEQ